MIIFLDWSKAALTVRLPKGEDEFTLALPLALGFEYEVQASEQTAFCLSCTFKIAAQFLSPDFPFYLIHDWLHSL